MRQVIAHDVFHHPSAGANHFTCRQDGLDAKHVVTRDAVLERARSARALGDVSADRRPPQTGRVRRVEQAHALDGILQVAGDHVRLDDRHEARFVDLEDAVHPLEADDHAALHWHGSAGESRAAAPRHDGRARFVACAHNRRDLAGRAGHRDDVGERATLERVDAVHPPRLVVGPDEVRSNDRADAVGDVLEVSGAHMDRNGGTWNRERLSEFPGKPNQPRRTLAQAVERRGVRDAQIAGRVERLTRRQDHVFLLEEPVRELE